MDGYCVIFKTKMPEGLSSGRVQVDSVEDKTGWPNFVKMLNSYCYECWVIVCFLQSACWKKINIWSWNKF